MVAHPLHALGLPGTYPSGRWQFPRLQLRGSAGFSPASLSSPSGEDALSEEDAKIKTTNGQNNRREESNGCAMQKSIAQTPQKTSGFEEASVTSYLFHRPTTYNTIESTTLISTEVASGK